MTTRKIDLKKCAGISLCYEKSELTSKDFTFEEVSDYKISHIREELLNRNIYCPENFYRKYIGADHNKILESKNLKLNYYLVYGGVAGIEYLKTHVYNTGKFSRALEILTGRGLLMIQHGDKNLNIRIRQGDKVLLPSKTTFIIVNIKYSPLIVEEMYNSSITDSKVDGGREAVPFFVINKNSKPVVVRNPNHFLDSEIEKIKFDDILDKYGISPKTPLIKQVMRKYEKFNWLLEPNFPIELY